MEASAAARADEETVHLEPPEMQTPDDNVAEPEPLDAETAENNNTDAESSEWESADEEIVTHGATATILRGVDWRDEGIDDEIQFSD